MYESFLAKANRLTKIASAWVLGDPYFWVTASRYQDLVMKAAVHELQRGHPFAAEMILRKGVLTIDSMKSEGAPLRGIPSREDYNKKFASPN